MIEKDSIIVLSGGMDSVTLLYEYKERIALAVTFDYGSNHNRREAECARLHCSRMGIRHIIIPLGFMGEYFKSSLLEGADAIPEGNYDDENMRSTVVPFRNGIMLSVACGLAESYGLKHVMIANHYGDHAIDLCIGSVENAEIRIVGNTFVGMSGQNTCIQIQQRNPNSSTDDNPGDWWGFDVDTSIKSAYITGNDFTQSKSPADVRLSSWPKAGDERTFTKAFPATIVAETATKVVSCTELGGNGNNSPLQDMNVELNAGAEFSVDGAYDYDAKEAALGYNLESGVATLSGYVP